MVTSRVETRCSHFGSGTRGSVLRPVRGTRSMARARPQRDGHCEVWWAGPELARPAHLALLNAGELDRRERLRRPVDRARFTVGAALLRLVVSRYTGDDPTAVTVDRTCADCGEMHGKPRVPRSGL